MKKRLLMFSLAMPLLLMSFPTSATVADTFFSAVRYGENVALEENLLMRFYVTYNDVALETGGKVELKVSKVDGITHTDTVKTYEKLTDGKVYEGNIYYYTVPLSAINGSDIVTLTVTASMGQTFSWSSSVSEYCTALAEQNSTDTALVNLCTAVKSYCNAASAYFDTQTTGYLSSFEKMYATYTTLADAREDQLLIEALIRRMGSGAAVSVGSSNVLYQGYKQKLDPADYSRTARLSDGDILIPAAFAERYFGRTLTKDSDSYVNLTELCASLSDYSLYHDTQSNFAVILPAEVPTFDGSTAYYGYTNTQYRQRIIDFFKDSTYEPANNSEQSRVEVATVEFVRDGDYTQKHFYTCASPSVTKTTENGNTVLYASYEVSETCHTLEEFSVVTHIKKSTDGGTTWVEVGTVDAMRWGSLFTLNNEVWLLGNHITQGNAMIAHLTADGTVETAILTSGVGGGAPTTVLLANDRVYKAYNDRTISAPITSDLMNADSWTVSADVRTLLDTAWLATETAKTYESLQTQECNLLLGPDGSIYNLMRIEGYVKDSYGNNNNVLGAGYAAILKLSAEGTAYEMHDSGSLISFPTGVSKFIIRYDESTQKYICISNLYTGAKLLNQRTVLAISTSSDLLTWETKDTLLVEREMMNADASAFAHGWQYADFAIDGDDLYYIVRESSGASNDWHSGNSVGFYKLENYRDIVN